MISVSMWQYRIGIKRIKNFENVLEKPVLNWYYFGIEVALKGEKPFKITVKIDNFNARIAHKTRKNTRKLLFLTLFYRERRTPKRNAVGSTPITDAKNHKILWFFLFGFRKPPAKRVVPKRLLPLNKNTFYDIIQAGLANRK